MIPETGRHSSTLYLALIVAFATSLSTLACLSGEDDGLYNNDLNNEPQDLNNPDPGDPSSNNPDPNPPEPKEPRGTCGLEPASAKPFERLVVDIPDGVLYADTCLDGYCHGAPVDDCTNVTDTCNEVVWGEVINEDYRYVQLLPLYQDEEGTWRLITPLHPETPMEGGTVRLRLADEYGACDPVDFTIEPLEPAPGTLQKLVDGLRVYADQKAQLMGYTLEEVWAMPVDEVPEPLLPLYVLFDDLDADDPNSVASMANGTAPFAQENPEAMQIFEAVLGRSDVEAYFNARVEHLKNPPEAFVSGFNLLTYSAIPGCVDIDNIRTPEKLEACMEMADYLDITLDKDSSPTKMLEDSGTFLAVAGIAPVPAIQAGAWTAAATLWAVRKAEEAVYGNIPSTLDRFKIEIEQDWKEEDDPARGTWKAELRGRSKGWNYTSLPAEAFSQILFSPLAPVSAGPGITRALGGVAGKAWRAGSVVDDPKVLSAVSEASKTARAAVGDFLADAADAWVGVKGGQLLSQTGEVDRYSIPSRTTPWIDVSDEEWTQRKPERGLLFTPHSNLSGEELHNEMWIRSGGPAMLSIRTQALRFAGQMLTQVESLSIPSIQILTDRSNFRATEDNQEFGFVVTVLNAQDPSIEIEVNKGRITEVRNVADDTLAASDANKWIIKYESPTLDELKEGDATIKISSDSEEGVYDTHLAPVRTAQVVVAADPRVQVSPRGSCLEKGDTLQFDARVTGVEDESVTWSTNIGSINANGLYTAPDVESYDIEVTATSVAAPSESDTVRIAVGVCDCWFQATWNGRTVYAQPGDRLDRGIMWYPYFPHSGVYWLVQLPRLGVLYFIPGLNIGYTGRAGPFLPPDSELGATNYELVFESKPGDRWNVSVGPQEIGGEPYFDVKLNTRDAFAASIVPSLRRGVKWISQIPAEYQAVISTLSLDFSIVSDDAGPRPQPGRNNYSCVVGE